MIPHHIVTGPRGRAGARPLQLARHTLDMWDQQVDALAERFRLVRYDTRGHGGSPTPPGPYALDDVGDDVIELLDHLGIERAHVAGLILGGMTGDVAGDTRARARRPARPAVHIAADGPPELWRSARAPSASRGRRRSSTPRGALAHGGLRAAHPKSPPSATCSAASRRGLRERLLDDRAHGPACRPADGVARPALVIAGAKNPATPPRSPAADRRRRSRAPGSRSSIPART